MPKTMLFKEYPDLLSVSEMQSALRIGRTTAYRLINNGVISHMKIGRKIKIPKAALVDYITKSCYNIDMATSKLTD